MVLQHLIPSLSAADQSTVAMEEDEEESFGSDITFLYSCLSMHSLQSSITIPSSIQSRPFPHQQACISWMCSREGMQVDPDEEKRYQTSANTLHSLFVPWPTQEGLFYSPITHAMMTERVSGEIPRRGGVLCDPMGLGKTFEILMLILSHPCPPSMISNGHDNDNHDNNDVNNRGYHYHDRTINDNDGDNDDDDDYEILDDYLDDAEDWTHDYTVFSWEKVFRWQTRYRPRILMEKLSHEQIVKPPIPMHVDSNQSRTC